MRVLRAKSQTLYDLLPPDVMGRLLSLGRSRTYADGQIVQERGDERPALSIVMRGEVVAGNLGLDGSLLASALLRPGETFGEFSLFAGLPRTQTLWAQGDTEITHVTAGRFWPFFEAEPALPRALLTLTVARNHEVLEFLEAQRRLKLPALLAYILLSAADEGARDVRVDCRQEDLGTMLGVSRVAVGKALQRLRRDGLVVPGYGDVRLPDVPRLRHWLAEQDQRAPLADGAGTA